MGALESIPALVNHSFSLKPPEADCSQGIHYENQIPLVRWICPIDQELGSAQIKLVGIRNKRAVDDPLDPPPWKGPVGMLVE